MLLYVHQAFIVVDQCTKYMYEQHQPILRYHTKLTTFKNNMDIMTHIWQTPNCYFTCISNTCYLITVLKYEWNQPVVLWDITANTQGVWNKLPLLQTFGSGPNSILRALADYAWCPIMQINMKNIHSHHWGKHEDGQIGRRMGSQMDRQMHRQMHWQMHRQIGPNLIAPNSIVAWGIIMAF